jgi:hypothetical protein
MNEQTEVGPDGPDLAADRVAEIDALSLSIRDLLGQMIAAFKDGTVTDPKDIVKKLSELQAAHLKVLSAEDAYHAKIGTDPDADAIDYDAVRDQVGCRLDRIRQSLVAEGFPCDADTRAACNAALSVRLLGDAASDRSER